MKKFRISQLLRARGDSSNFKYEVATLKVHASSKFTLPPARAGARACQILRVLLVSWPPSLAAGLRRPPGALSKGAESRRRPQWIRNVDHESAAWLRGSPGLHGCAATLHGCAEAPHGRAKPRAAARGRARRLRRQPRSQLRGLSLSSKLKLCIHSRVPTEGGRGRAAAQAAARGAAGRAPRRVRPNCLRCDRQRRALFGEKASKPKNRRAPAWPQDGRAAGEMAARLHSHGW